MHCPKLLFWRNFLICHFFRESAVVSLLLSLSLPVCMNDFSANFLLISNVTGNGVITWELRSRCSISISVAASGVLSQQDPAVPYHCHVCSPSANLLCIHMWQNISQSKSCTLNKGELWTSIFQEHFMFYLLKRCFKNCLPSCRTRKR